MFGYEEETVAVTEGKETSVFNAETVESGYEKELGRSIKTQLMKLIEEMRKNVEEKQENGQGTEGIHEQEGNNSRCDKNYLQQAWNYGIIQAFGILCILVIVVYVLLKGAGIVGKNGSARRIE